MRDIFRGTGAVIGGLVAFFALILVLIYAFGGISQITADFRGETDKKNKVEANGSYRIAAYDHFFDLCAGVQAAEDQIRLQEAAAKQLPKSEQPRINQNILAQSNKRVELIRQYNADAQKSYTSGQFRDSRLPFQLDISSEETQCTV